MLVTSWRPTDTTAVVEKIVEGGTGLARPIEVRIAQPTGTAAPPTLFGDTDIIRLAYVSP